MNDSYHTWTIHVHLVLDVKPVLNTYTDTKSIFNKATCRQMCFNILLMMRKFSIFVFQCICRCTCKVILHSISSKAADFWVFVRPAASPCLSTNLAFISGVNCRVILCLLSMWEDANGCWQPSAVFDVSPPSQEGTKRDRKEKPRPSKTFASPITEFRQDGSFKADEKCLKIMC